MKEVMKMKLASRIFKRDDYYITSPYGTRIHPTSGVNSFHYGCDYGTDLEKWNQYALEDGKVTKKGYNASGAGNYIYIEYPRLNIICLHYHLDEVFVNVGDTVNENTILGTTGTTGNSTGIHLDLGVLVGEVSNYKYIDPETYDYIESAEQNENIDYKFSIGDKVIINGNLYKNSTNKTPSGKIENKITNITRIEKNSLNPYNTTDDLGWMREESIEEYKEESYFKKGSKVNLKEYVNSKGLPLKNYDPFYYITEWVEDSDTCVLSAERNGIYYVWARVNKDNLISE